MNLLIDLGRIDILTTLGVPVRGRSGCGASLHSSGSLILLELQPSHSEDTLLDLYLNISPFIFGALIIDTISSFKILFACR